MNANNGTIGVLALYLLFIWLASAAGAGWVTGRKGYGERLGLLFGLVLTAAGLILALLLPGRPGSKWKIDGPLPRRRRAVEDRRPASPPQAGNGGLTREA